MNEHAADAPAADTPTHDRSGFSRRGFLAGAAGLTGVAVTGAWRGLPALASEGRPTLPPALPYWFLELEGVNVGQLKSVEGGYPVAEVVTETPGPDGVARKHLGDIRFEDIVMKVGLGMRRDFYQWLTTTLSGFRATRSGAVIGADFNRNIKRRIEFTSAVISEVTFPGLDAASDEQVFLTLAITPLSVQKVPASGSASGLIGGKTKAWISGQFRASIGNLPGAKISKIDPIVVRTTPGGSGRGLQQITLDISNVGITLLDSPAWNTFFNNFVINGNNSEADEIPTGSIQALGSDLTTVLAQIDLRQIGIFSLQPAGAEPGAGLKDKAGLYVEQIGFQNKTTSA